MDENIIHVIKDIQSQQSDKDGNLIVDLKKGDVVSLKDDGVYITKKINVSSPAPNWRLIFDEIKKQNLH